MVEGERSEKAHATATQRRGKEELLHTFLLGKEKVEIVRKCDRVHIAVLVRVRLKVEERKRGRESIRKGDTDNDAVGTPQV